MINIFILVLELGLLVYLVFFKLNNDKLVKYLDDKFSERLTISESKKKITSLFQKMIFIFLVGFYIYGFILNLMYPSFSLILFFALFIVLSFIFCLLSPGKFLSSITFSTKSDTFFSVQKRKTINLFLYLIFLIGFFSIGVFMIQSSLLNSNAKIYSVDESSNKEFPIDFETNLFIEGEFLYLYSDLASGINVYTLDGEYLRSYYFYGGMNGSSMLYFKDDYFFLSTKHSDTLIRYQDGFYKGHLEVSYFDEYDQITVYDEFGNIIIPSFPLEDYWTIFAFDSDYVYYEASSAGGGFFKTDGIVLEQWDKDYETLISQVEDGEYVLKANKVYKNNEVLIMSSELHYLTTHFFYTWVILLMYFSIAFSMTKLIYLNDLTDIQEVKPIRSKTSLELIDRYRKSMRLDFFVSVFFSFVLFLIYNLLIAENFSEFGIIFLFVFFFIGIIFNDLLFGFSSLGKRRYKLKLVDTETNGKPKVKAVIKRRMLEIFSAVEVTPETLDKIDNKTRTKIIDKQDQVTK